VSARRVLLVALGLVIVGALVLIATPSGRGFLQEAVAWLRGAGAVGRAAAIGLAMIGIPLGIPTLWFAALIGYLFGVAAGIPLALGAIVAGATIAFVIARWLLADEVAERVRNRPRWRAVVQAVGDEGVRLVILLRLAGPHNLLNLILAASTVRKRDFLIGTTIGAIPSVALAATGGALAPDAGSLWDARDRIGWAWIPVVAIGAVALIAAIWLTARATRRAMARASSSRA
jgi:uncharacterized membrane protein YdjX (TVP38/TMEM64 family)